MSDHVGLFKDQAGSGWDVSSWETKTEFDIDIEGESKIDKDMNILTCWKNNKSSYPILAKNLNVFYRYQPLLHPCKDYFQIVETQYQVVVHVYKLNQLLSTRHNLSLLTESFSPSIEPIRKPKYSIEEDADNDISQDDLDNITFKNHDEKENNTCEDSFPIWLRTN